MTERADRACRQAVFCGDTSDLLPALESLVGDEPGTDLARGMLRHSLALAGGEPDAEELACFERAAEEYRRRGDRAGEGRALFWQGCYHQVLGKDGETAVPLLERAATLSRDADDDLWLSYSLRHLAIARHQAGDLDGARDLLEQSTRLRRAVGFEEGVAANLVGLAFVAVDRGDRAGAERIAREAIEVGTASGASTMVTFAEQALNAAAQLRT
ncbi:Tetratricopeptide repeat-containing protein [Actinopolymorpha cephalotaxi]|uniref:Tetratricopeptide (TPR) repeat protein n=1 Tax=Actinopolymorpha cephalotaxi TaxID=504797 RepID=A0A1I3BWZ1_9ACTN|nr:tetratricopeptide repeat protein [Actinopolymorpha cephalotaxi]NYH86335.1 tetratricopeptide (TPR) repeat protein [Actinopolymorpha cephalotaxi]SFH66868.1 Tetratricopeptide repeat-containing protein [Actinopolymorpha cephalotaxi]